MSLVQRLSWLTQWKIALPLDMSDSLALDREGVDMAWSVKGGGGFSEEVHNTTRIWRDSPP